MKLLEVKNLKVYYKTAKGDSKAADDVSFTLEEGQYLGLVGESGCGKTTVAKAILGILPDNAYIPSGQVLYKGQDMVQMKAKELQKLRWTEISTIPQSAMNTLDPVYRVGDQMVEVIRLHTKLNKKEAMDIAAEKAEKVGIERELLSHYPHQFSAGMRQRLTIANSLTLDPTLIVADEPTTGLDVIVQDQILELIGDLQRSLGKAMLLITHNMSVVAENCPRVVVMYAGKVMEYGDTAQVMTTPFNPYSLGLKNAFPQLHGEVSSLISIPGSPPNLVNPPSGCRFHTRCPFVEPICSQKEPPLVEVGREHYSACHLAHKADELRAASKDPATWGKVVVAEV